MPITLADMFTCASLTESINLLPTVPGKVNKLGIFKPKGVTTTTVLIEESAGKLSLVQSQPRGGNGTAVRGKKPRIKPFQTVHLPEEATILPDELQNIRPFGSEGNAAVPQSKLIADRLQDMKNNLDATREHLRIGALKGQILDADGSLILDLYDEFKIPQRTMSFALSTPSTKMREMCIRLKRSCQKALEGRTVTGWHVFCGSDWLDAFVHHPDLEKQFLNWQAAQKLSEDYRDGFNYCGMTFAEYDVEVSGRKFIADDEARVVPIANGLYASFNAPANYNETVNTVGLEYYAKSEERKMNKGWDLEAQSNPLDLCLAPGGLLKLTK